MYSRSPNKFSFLVILGDQLPFVIMSCNSAVQKNFVVVCLCARVWLGGKVFALAKNFH